MANYPDYWPKQMKFRDKKNIDDAHRRKTRHNSPGSYHPGYDESIDERTKTEGIVVKSSSHIQNHDSIEYKHISDYVKNSINHEKKKSNIKENKSDYRMGYLVKQKAVEHKNRLLRGLVFYHEKKGIFPEREFIQDKQDEYILLFCGKYENIGAFYNGKGMKFLGRDYGEDGSLISLNRMIGHLTFDDKCLNLITNERWSAVLDNNSGCLNRGNTSLVQIENMVERLKEKKMVLKVWYFPDDTNEIKMTIEKIGSVKKL